MQTFLPFADFAASARVLDNKRLGKQRVECLQLLNCLNDPRAGWYNHPAAKMWRGYKQALVKYTLTVCIEWVERGFDDTIANKAVKQHLKAYDYRKPWWLDDERLHASHRSNLKRKDPITYGHFDEPNDLPYYWPYNPMVQR